jgi:hypothetical protein
MLRCVDKHFRVVKFQGLLFILSIIACANYWYEKACKGTSKEHLTIKIMSRNLLTVCCPKSSTKDSFGV